MKEGGESKNVNQLKSTLKSLGVNLPDNIITKMLPHFDSTTLMERILATESLSTINEGLGVMENNGMKDENTEIDQVILRAKERPLKDTQGSPLKDKGFNA